MKDIPKIAFEHSPLAAFTDQVGLIGYGSEWVAKSKLTKEGQLRPADARHEKMHADVFKQISLALGHGLAEAEVVIDLCEIGTGSGSDISEVSDFTSDDSDISDTDLPIQKEHFVLSPSFWRRDWQSSIQDWQSSTLMIALDFLRISASNPFGGSQVPTRSFSKGRPDLRQYRKVCKSGQVFVKRSEIALGYISGSMSLFPKVGEDRYKGQDNRFRDELIAVVWRHLAVTLIRSGRKEVKPKNIKKIMHDYVNLIGFDEDENGLSASTIAAITTKIYEQFRNGEVTTIPFVNSTSKRTKARKSFNKQR